MAGFTHGEQALLTLLVRYHRKGNPKPGELASVLSEREADLFEKAFGRRLLLRTR